MLAPADDARQLRFRSGHRNTGHKPHNDITGGQARWFLDLALSRSPRGNEDTSPHPANAVPAPCRDTWHHPASFEDESSVRALIINPPTLGANRGGVTKQNKDLKGKYPPVCRGIGRFCDQGHLFAHVGKS